MFLGIFEAALLAVKFLPFTRLTAKQASIHDDANLDVVLCFACFLDQA